MCTRGTLVTRQQSACREVLAAQRQRKDGARAFTPVCPQDTVVFCILSLEPKERERVSIERGVLTVTGSDLPRHG